MKGKTFNIALPAELVKEVDKAARKEYKNRSELIREALYRYLQDIEEREDLFAYGRSVTQKMGLKSEKQINKIVHGYRHGKTKSRR